MKTSEKATRIFDMLGDEREDQVPVHGVEHAEQVCGKEECVVVEETCQFRPGG